MTIRRRRSRHNLRLLGCVANVVDIARAIALSWKLPVYRPSAVDDKFEEKLGVPGYGGFTGEAIRGAREVQG